MAAAGLLRSVARKLARAPPPHPLARGPPPTSVQVSTYPRPIQQGMGNPLAVGRAAAAAGLRSGAGLSSLARKVARAPPHHSLLHGRGLHNSTNTGASGSTPPLTSDKDLIENLRIRLRFVRISAIAAGIVMVYLYYWALPKAKAQAYSRGYSRGYFRGKISNLDDYLTHIIENLESIRDENVEIMESSGTDSGHGGTRVDNKSEVDQVLKAFPVMVKEIADCIKDIEANVNATGTSIKDRHAAASKFMAALESPLSEGERSELMAVLESALSEGERKE